MKREGQKITKGSKGALNIVEGSVSQGIGQQYSIF